MLHSYMTSSSRVLSSPDDKSYAALTDNHLDSLTHAFVTSWLVYSSKDTGHEAVQHTGHPRALHCRSSNRHWIAPPLSILPSHKCSTKCKGLIHSFTIYAKDIFYKYTQKTSTMKISVQHILPSHITEGLHQRIKYAAV